MQDELEVRARMALSQIKKVERETRIAKQQVAGLLTYVENLEVQNENESKQSKDKQ